MIKWAGLVLNMLSKSNLESDEINYCNNQNNPKEDCYEQRSVRHQDSFGTFSFVFFIYQKYLQIYFERQELTQIFFSQLPEKEIGRLLLIKARRKCERLRLLLPHKLLEYILKL